ncbi:MAG: hypothetical protein E5X88_12845 [Mesorhizobium sp.]|uniref:hypothetical protein n=1 Tax=Mesorhizobium sp. TaxID=1871066 RepID=UPI0012011EC4|nr:hypothetical protein [Mesorhizobium sp.]TIO08494.1 MAG: hypothetical protein E5X88_12845 [Mesorhizobium sp.]TIP13101.1 MAG: hypothetical protein E5X73_09705 [Mesorhizobium sp.]
MVIVKNLGFLLRNSQEMRISGFAILERRAPNWTHKVRLSTDNLRIVLSEPKVSSKIESGFQADAIANVKAAATFEIDKRAGICREWMLLRPIGTSGASC